MRIKFLSNEKTTYIKLRRRGYSINQLSKYFGRSRSVVSRIIKIAEKRRIIWRTDLRKLPDKARKHFTKIQHKMMSRLLPLWEQFMLVESEIPP